MISNKILINLIISSCMWLSSSSGQLHESYQQIEDYHVLANAIDWSEYLSQQWIRESNIESLRLLDIGCGTGRWLNAFQDKIIGRVQFPIMCDLLDPSSIALQEASKTLHPPLFLKGLIQETVQEAELLRGHYDIIWAMHSFYSIQKHHLTDVLKKCIGNLKENGDFFIALASNKSFYIQFYSVFRSCFSIDQVESYTSAEMILNVFRSFGLDIQLKIVEYAEKIHVEDIQKLSHYLLNECVGYSFDRDNSLVKQISVMDILNHPKTKAFLDLQVVGDHYEFLQEVWILKGSKK